MCTTMPQLTSQTRPSGRSGVRTTTTTANHNHNNHNHNNNIPKQKTHYCSSTSTTIPIRNDAPSATITGEPDPWRCSATRDCTDILLRRNALLTPLRWDTFTANQRMGWPMCVATTTSTTNTPTTTTTIPTTTPPTTEITRPSTPTPPNTVPKFKTPECPVFLPRPLPTSNSCEQFPQCSPPMRVTATCWRPCVQHSVCGSSSPSQAVSPVQKRHSNHWRGGDGVRMSLLPVVLVAAFTGLLLSPAVVVAGLVSVGAEQPNNNSNNSTNQHHSNHNSTAHSMASLGHQTGATQAQQSHLTDRLNPIELSLLDRLMAGGEQLQQQHHQPQFHHNTHRHYHKQAGSGTYGDTFTDGQSFDPSSEEITLKLESTARKVSNSQPRAIHLPIEAGLWLHHHQQQQQQQQSKPNTFQADPEFQRGDQHHQPKPETEPHGTLSWAVPYLPSRTHLTLNEAHALVQSVINNGLVEKLDWNTLRNLTAKYFPNQRDKDEDFMGLHSETDDSVTAQSSVTASGQLQFARGHNHAEAEDPLNPEEELLTINHEPPKRPEHGHNPSEEPNQIPKHQSQSSPPGPSFESSILNEDLFRSYDNLEHVMAILMHSENTLKKRGEGPQLSIDSALTVLRERLLLELARRRAKATQDQIAINKQILEKLGRRRRRRRRSVDDDDTVGVDRESPRTAKAALVNCDEVDCTLADLNSQWSNVHESLSALTTDHKPSNAGKSSSHQFGSYPVYLNYHDEMKPNYFYHNHQQSSNPVSSQAVVSKPSTEKPQRFRANDKYIDTFDVTDHHQEREEPENELNQYGTVAKMSDKMKLEAKSEDRSEAEWTSNPNALAFRWWTPVKSGTMNGDHTSHHDHHHYHSHHQPVSTGGSDRNRINSRKPIFLSVLSATRAAVSPHSGSNRRRPKGTGTEHTENIGTIAAVNWSNLHRKRDTAESVDRHDPRTRFGTYQWK